MLDKQAKIMLDKQAKIKNALSKRPDQIDIHVGTRLRMRRNMVGLSQEQLGKILGLTFQQIQKYERGINRMGSSRLFQISRALSVPVTFFFENLPMQKGLSARSESAHDSETAADVIAQADYGILSRRETLELVRAYYRIKGDEQRRRVYELICSIADAALPAKNQKLLKKA